MTRVQLALLRAAILVVATFLLSATLLAALLVLLILLVGLLAGLSALLAAAHLIVSILVCHDLHPLACRSDTREEPAASDAVPAKSC
ncbi:MULTISPECIES: hypothetical protein [Sphingobium]|uniref:hypothetical protein n=1 Tax=Sphingobium TaxID=165695 RepID=UPI0007700DD5|nr:MULTISPECIES: hypothetical protein [Sphingobium]AMK26640.1 hypothetical protein K426_28725 [Sphingobium sp. TKS]AMK26802.1 hypothetical protein K426_29560 [Sphingobium sp. TKS]